VSQIVDGGDVGGFPHDTLQTAFVDLIAREEDQVGILVGDARDGLVVGVPEVVGVPLPAGARDVMAVEPGEHELAIVRGNRADPPFEVVTFAPAGSGPEIVGHPVGHVLVSGPIVHPEVCRRAQRLNVRGVDRAPTGIAEDLQMGRGRVTLT